MVEAALSVELAVAPGRLFEFVSDPRNEPRWRREIVVSRRRASVVSVEPGDRSPALGAIYRRVLMHGQEQVEIEFDVTEWDPHRRVAFRDRTSDGNLVRLELEPSSVGTRLTYQQCKPATMGPGPLRRLSTWGTRAPMADDLAHLAEALGLEARDAKRVVTPGAVGPPFEDVMDVAALPEEVFAYLADPRNQPAWRLKGDELTVDVRWDEPSLGARYRTSSVSHDGWSTWEVMEFDPPRLVRFVNVDGKIRGDIRFVLEPIEVGTSIRYRLSYSARSRGWNRFFRVLAYAWVMAMSDELRRIGRAVTTEAESPARARRNDS
jgi:uncharacterized protein YndB with AHSA1/START domain